MLVRDAVEHPQPDRLSPDLAAALAPRLAALWDEAPAGAPLTLSLRLPGPPLRHLPAQFPHTRFLARPELAQARLGIGRALERAADGAGRLERLSERLGALRPMWRHDGALPPALFVAMGFDAAAAAVMTLPLLHLTATADGNVATFAATRQPGRRRDAVLDEWVDAAEAVVAAMAETPPRAAGPLLRIDEAPDARAWIARVERALAAIDAGALEKVVLTRRVRVASAVPFAAPRLTRLLAARHPGCAVLAWSRDEGLLVAATPERLASLRGGHLTSDALAGTCGRDSDPAADARLGQALLDSAKERHEHRLVVDWITGAFAEVCDLVEVPASPDLMRLPRLQHLWTPVRGRLRRDRDLLDAVARLHPTPAVAGLPVTPALAWLAENGDDRESLYTGVAGWMDLAGDGEFHVVLRAASLRGREADLFAGAGIVARSNPEAEFAETELKLRTMLDALRDG